MNRRTRRALAGHFRSKRGITKSPRVKRTGRVRDDETAARAVVLDGMRKAKVI